MPTGGLSAVMPVPGGIPHLGSDRWHHAFMAKISQFFRTSTDSRPHPTSVQCGWQVVSSPDGDMLQLSTYGSESRASQQKVSQTLQLNKEAAAELIDIVKRAFPGLS
jgi:5-methylcytosine-specific restriction protein B